MTPDPPSSPLQVIMFISFTSMVFLHAYGNAVSLWGITYRVDLSFKEALIGEEWNANQNLAFEDIAEPEEFWAWVENVLLEKVYADSRNFRVGQSIVATSNFGITAESRLMGPILFRQQRVFSQGCSEVVGLSAQSSASTKDLESFVDSPIGQILTNPDLKVRV
jgi:hypothetical protein